jgi:antitoxin YefM
MSSATYKEAKEDLDKLWDQAVSTREPIVIESDGKESIAIIAADELAGYMETAHLLSSPKNVHRLLNALDRQSGEGLAITLEELKRQFDRSIERLDGQSRCGPGAHSRSGARPVLRSQRAALGASVQDLKWHSTRLPARQAEVA